jgi:hypothetical protein
VSEFGLGRFCTSAVSGESKEAKIITKILQFIRCRENFEGRLGLKEISCVSMSNWNCGQGICICTEKMASF